jgi:hypothetical protein
MKNFPIEIPKYDSTTSTWSFETFTKNQFYLFIKDKIKSVGNYGLVNTENWKERSIFFQKNKTYFKNLKHKSEEYIEKWEFEKLKCRVGVIFDDFYVTHQYYHYLNYSPIYIVNDEKFDFPEVWDSHYDYCLHKELAALIGKYVPIVKKRRWGYSYLECSDFARQYFFEKDTINKIIHRDVDISEKAFKMIEDMKTFMNENTAWYRHTTGTYPKIIQRLEKQDLTTKRRTYTGRNNIIEGISTKTNPAKGVGLYANKLFFDEAGISPHLIKSINYNEKSIKQGGVVKGEIIVGGSVGELKDCEDLRDLIFTPDAYGFYGVLDETTGEKRGIFVPEQYNYIQETRDENDVVIGYTKFYDKDGNSDVDGALAAILSYRVRLKNQSPTAYRLACSQSPISLDEAFGEREDNKFPTHIINDQRLVLESSKKDKQIPVELKKENLKISHVFSENKKVTDFPLKKSQDIHYRDGGVIIYEFPLKNAPPNTYFAGIDPVSAKRTTTLSTNSLMCCYIIRGEHIIDGKIMPKQIVAEYTGRFEDPYKTYETVTMLWEFYNARPLIENNHESYIQWLISKKRHHNLIRTSELSNLKELSVNYNSNSDYGITTKNKDFIHDIIIEYLEQEVSKSFNEKNGDVKVVRGVDLVFDEVLLKEMAIWSKNLNTDRIVAFGLALWCTRIFNEMNNGSNTIVTKDDNKKYHKFNKKQSMFNQNTGSMFSKRKFKMF